jgi:inhibitor of cysteine peptidase
MGVLLNFKTIKVNLGNSFKISLDSNPSTGYQWELDFDTNFITLEKKSYNPSNSKLGGTGKEHFIFLPLRSGKTTITMQYKRTWEKSEIIKEKFLVEII